LIQDYNLIATSEPLNQSAAARELWMLLRAVGDEEPRVDGSFVKGLVVARTGFDPPEAIRKLREEFLRQPDRFKTLLRIIPIEARVQTDMDSIRDGAKVLSSKIGEGDSFRITLEKRRTPLRSREVIDAVAEGIPRRVDLENPDWVVLIEIIGRTTGISVVKPDAILNVQKERARLSANLE